MSTYKATINITTDNSNLFANLKNVSISNAFRNIGNHFQAVGQGAITEKVTVNSGTVYGAVTFTMTAAPTANDTITINSVVLTAVTTPATSIQWKVGNSGIDSAQNLANCINANLSLNPLFRATAKPSGTTEGGIVTITALATSVASYTLSKSMSVGTLSSTSLVSANGPVSATDVFTITASNLSAADTVKVGVTTFTAEASGAVGNQFNVGSSALATAQNLAAAINAYVETATVFSAVATGTTTGIVTVTVLLPGKVGNNIPVTKSATNGSWSGSTFFTGGADASVLTLNHGL